ncbi:hypothetical protein CHS0354_025444, partial [Potamilus streckersoni]
MSILESAAIYMAVIANCSALGKCQKNCLATVREIRKNPCFQGDINKFQRFGSVHMNVPYVKSATRESYGVLDSCSIGLALQAVVVNDLQKYCV